MLIVPKYCNQPTIECSKKILVCYIVAQRTIHCTLRSAALYRDAMSFGNIDMDVGVKLQVSHLIFHGNYFRKQIKSLGGRGIILSCNFGSLTGDFFFFLQK